MRRIAGVKRNAWSKTDDLREDMCIEKCIMRRFVMSRVKWTGHVEIINEDRLTRITQVHQGKRRMKATFASIKRYTEKAEVEDEGWKTVARHRGQWRKVVHKTTKSCREIGKEGRERWWEARERERGHGFTRDSFETILLCNNQVYI